MALDFTQFNTQVTRLGTVKAGVLALIAKLKENAGDPAELTRLVNEFSAHQDELAAAVVANTPSEPTPA